MGHVHDVPNVTILQLREEAHERFGRRLDPVDRQIILLAPTSIGPYHDGDAWRGHPAP